MNQRLKLTSGSGLNVMNFTNNLKIKFYDGWIPEKNVKPNYGTLVYELSDSMKDL